MDLLFYSFRLLLFQVSGPFFSPVLVSFAIPRTKAPAREHGASEKWDVRVRLDARKKFFTERVLSYWNRLSKEAVGSIYLKPGWMGLWATWSGGWDTCPGGEFETRLSLRSFLTQIILWFCDSVKCLYVAASTHRDTHIFVVCSTLQWFLALQFLLWCSNWVLHITNVLCANFFTKADNTVVVLLILNWPELLISHHLGISE